MQFEKIVIHFQDSTGTSQQAVILRESGVRAIFLDENAAREFVTKPPRKRAKLSPPPEAHVTVFNAATGARVPQQELGSFVMGTLPPIPDDGDGPRVWYDVDDGVFCW